MEWSIYMSRRVQDQIKNLHNDDVLCAIRLLVDCLKTKGPIPGRQWKNYSKLTTKKSEDKRHCHLVVGKPTYVCCWEVINKKKRVIEVYYVGTHEKAPY